MLRIKVFQNHESFLSRLIAFNSHKWFNSHSPFQRWRPSAHIANVKFGFATFREKIEENCLEQQMFEIMRAFYQYQLHASSVNGSKVIAIFQDGRHRRIITNVILLSLALFLEHMEKNAQNKSCDERFLARLIASN